ncbi:TetR/AcrR family transcriptional regulator [Neobacillus sp. OS1-32]|jgi:TetR/AcrR family transcriptional repressor of mexJK operon|uniref:TetR/AcrR family transcriptional regulator n=1 Tax=Neobacillus paridis TaxID=2803862 RepID=A0ABS1TNR5_9BACI|nr:MULTISPECIES: TetR/AcrR family transcriptional regulator [Neobacillus]MBL4952975.1 TetR/AcrR family transcriptional regulator [Neobacillus paridis]WML31505.1 TetR/AcrR family transcriptional regulator [Neobacillus sp. OS1-32]
MSDREDQLVGEFPFIPRQERAQQKRKALLESGRILFTTKGYEHTTAKEIAAHAGVATGTFYRYFSDKRQLLMALLEDKIDQFLAPEPHWFCHDPVSLLASLLEAHVLRLNHSGLHRVLPEILSKDLDLAEVIQAARKRIHAKILSSLKQIHEKNLTWRDLDLDTVAWSIMMLFENSHKKAEQTGEKVNYREMAKVICRMIFPPHILDNFPDELK